MSVKQLRAMAEEAIVDCYDENEQASGWYTMIEDNLVVPFETVVLGVDVTVESFDQTGGVQIVAICCRNEVRQAIPILTYPCRRRRRTVRSGSTLTATCWDEPEI